MDEFLALTGFGESIASDLVRFLAKNKIGKNTSDRIEFDAYDKMKLYMLTMQRGADPEDVSQLLSWKDFEMLAAGVLDADGYATYHTFRLKRPRVEIDVVGIKGEMALLVDCKHWKRSSPSPLEKFALLQTKRAEVFLKGRDDVTSAVPVILTLHSETTVFAVNVPVVPIMKFRSFLNEMHGYLGDIKVVHTVG